MHMADQRPRRLGLENGPGPIFPARNWGRAPFFPFFRRVFFYHCRVEGKSPVSTQMRRTRVSGTTRIAIMLTVCAIATGPATQVAHSARPMITDDARTVDSKACQVESWVRFNRES